MHAAPANTLFCHKHINPVKSNESLWNQCCHLKFHYIFIYDFYLLRLWICPFHDCFFSADTIAEPMDRGNNKGNPTDNGHLFLQRSNGEEERSGSEGSEEDDDYVPYVPVKIRKQQMVRNCALSKWGRMHQSDTHTLSCGSGMMERCDHSTLKWFICPSYA